MLIKKIVSDDTLLPPPTSPRRALGDRPTPSPAPGHEPLEASDLGTGSSEAWTAITSTHARESAPPQPEHAPVNVASEAGVSPYLGSTVDMERGADGSELSSQFGDDVSWFEPEAGGRAAAQDDQSAAARNAVEGKQPARQETPELRDLSQEMGNRLSLSERKGKEAEKGGANPWHTLPPLHPPPPPPKSPRVPEPSQAQASVGAQDGQPRHPPPTEISSARDGTTPSRPAPIAAQETYQIKHILWSSPEPGETLRRSPILVQNVNGPCPLLALVNALSLSVPSQSTSGLLETLRVREHVSLGLLLDAVFDELMQRGGSGAAPSLPDVTDLYAFLLTLHTGMNVNPVFVPAPRHPPNLMDAPVDVVPADAAVDEPPLGSFEETQGMQLYGTFSIPLVHGWFPSKDHPAYGALQRSARSYEDAQNLLFREEELEAKLRADGLTVDEQQLLQDIVIIKYFLAQSATQLTEYGLTMLTKAMAPGAIVILFRNDHFSTIYKQPGSQRLFQLVTDMGYAAREDVVWESLVDLLGERSEFFSGDFRPVGGAPSPRPSLRSGPGLAPSTTAARAPDRGTPPATHDGGGGGRSADPARAPDPAVGSSTPTPATPGRGPAPAPGLDPSSSWASNPNAEQEDHDLALALQMQEEEEDRHQRDLAVRRREEDLTRQVLSPPHRAPLLPPVIRHGPLFITTATTTTGGGRRAPPSQPPFNRSTTPLSPAAIAGPPLPTRRRSGVGFIAAANASASASRPLRAPAPAPADDAPPPTYEQSASDTPYHPPGSRIAAPPLIARRPVSSYPQPPHPHPHPHPRPLYVGPGSAWPASTSPTAADRINTNNNTNPNPNPFGQTGFLGRLNRQNLSPTTTSSSSSLSPAAAAVAGLSPSTTTTTTVVEGGGGGGRRDCVVM
ncbi:MAG: hypothetical protein M1826_003365 [Phylliscum demangeonii]|nr:MAG: hypothetical protein M1826_003365 [Phylliscum demangeonii]